MSRRRGEGRLILPWEEEQAKMPRAVKVILFVVIVGAVLAALMNQCSVPEAGAADRGSATYWPERQTKALESIADSLKKIERKLK